VSKSSSAPPLLADDARKLADLLEERRELGHVSLDRVVHTLKDVELAPDVIAAIKQACADAGIELDESDDSPVPPDIAIVTHAEPVEQAEPAEPDGVSPERRAADKVRVARAAEIAASIGDDVEEDAPHARRPHPRQGSDTGSTDDPVRMYLREIGQVPLLDTRQEVRIAARIRRGVEAAQTLVAAGLMDSEGADDSRGDGPPPEPIVLEPSERARLERLVRDGHRASDQLTRANLRLVVSIAKRYVGRGMMLLDLVQEGNLGLMRAVEKFDHTKGFKFSTYATWWIRQAITRAIADQARTIRIPVHMVEAMNRVKRIQRQMHQQLKREPTVEELAAEVDEPVEKIRDILRISQDLLSLDSPVGEEDDSNLGDFIEDKNAAVPVDEATRVLLASDLAEVIHELSEREQEVVRLRFGLVDGRPRTLEEVGREFGVTRERIRQIEAKTLAKLRHPNRSDRLRPYMEPS